MGEDEERPAATNRAKTLTVVIVAVVVVVSVVLCCIALNTAGQLFDVDPRLRPP